eukprot:3361274-Amphidinium_carterae.2
MRPASDRVARHERLCSARCGHVLTACEPTHEKSSERSPSLAFKSVPARMSSLGNVSLRARSMSLANASCSGIAVSAVGA